MSILIIGLLMIWNLFVCASNAYYAGRTWNEGAGMWMKCVLWAALIMSVCGFAEVLAISISGIGLLAHFITQAQFKIILELVYGTIIVPVLGTGLIITIESWRQFVRDKDWMSGASATYNTLAMASNIYSLSKSGGSIFKDIGKFLSSDDEDNWIIYLIVGTAFVVSFGLTYWFWWLGRKHSVQAYQQRSI